MTPAPTPQPLPQQMMPMAMNQVGSNTYASPAPVPQPMAQPMMPSNNDPMGLSQFQASDFELQQKHDVQPQPQAVMVPPPMVEQPRTMGTLQQLTAKSMGEEVGPQTLQNRSIGPIFKPVPKQDPEFKVTDVAAPVAPVALAVEDGKYMPAAPQEDVWTDAFSQPGLKPDNDVLRSSRLYEKIH